MKRWYLALAFILFGAVPASAQTTRWVCALADPTCGGTPAYATPAAAYSAASCGDTIKFKNETFTYTTLTFNKVCASNNRITLEGSLLATTGPAAGVRLIPTVRADGVTAPNGKPLNGNTNPANMPTFVANSGGNPGIQFAAGASGHIIRYIRFRGNAGGFDNIIAIGTSTGQEFFSQEPNDILIDRVLMEPDHIVGQLRGILTNGRNITISNSYFVNFGGVGQDTQVLGGFNGTGPVTVTNNYMEGATENAIWGGGDPQERTFVTTTTGSTSTNIIVDPLTFRAGHSFAVNAYGDAAAMVGKEIAVQYDASTAVEYCHAFVTAVNSGTNTITVDTDPATGGNQGCPGAPPTGMDVRWGANFRNLVFERNHLTRLTSWQNPILSTPTITSVTDSNAAGTLAAGAHIYQVSARNLDGYQGADLTSASSTQMTCTLDAVGQCTINWNAVSGATQYRVFSVSRGVYFTVTAPTVTFTDTGAAGTAGTPPTSGTKWQVKNLFELKQTVGATIRYNILEYTWTSPAGNNYPVTLKSTNQNSGAEFQRTADITFSYNVIRHSAGCFSITSQEEVATGISARPFELDNLLVEHNICYDSGPGWATGSIWMAQFGYSGPTNFVFRNNTTVHRTYGTFGFGDAEVPLGGVNTMSNNVFFHNTYGFDSNAAGTTYGITSIDAHFGSANFLNNIVTSSSYAMPATTLRPDNATLQAEFVNYGGPNITDYAWRTGSPYITGGTGGSRIGADIASLNTLVAGVLEGQPANAPVITTTTLQGGTVSVAYSQTVQHTGGTGAKTCSVVAGSGSLPAGLSLGSSTCTISGTPSSAGTSNFTIRVTDTIPLSDDQALSIVISASNPSVTITTTSLQDVVANTAYSQTLAATGGNGSFQWSIANGNLPTGLALNAATGVISGTPTTANVYPFTIRVTSGAATDTQDLTIRVSAVGPVEPVGDVGRPEVWNGQQLRTFRGETAPTAAEPDKAAAKDIWIDPAGRLCVLTATSPTTTYDCYTKTTEDHFIVGMGMSIGENNVITAPAGGREYGSGSAGTDPVYRPAVDLSGVTEFRFCGHISDASPVAGNTIRPEYSIDSGSNWLQLAATADAASQLITSTGRFSLCGTWHVMATGARTEVWLRLWQTTGNSSDTTGFKAVYLEMR